MDAVSSIDAWWSVLNALTPLSLRSFTRAEKKMLIFQQNADKSLVDKIIAHFATWRNRK
jgi:predicted secreted protein